MSETYPNKGTRETLFAGHTPSSAGSRCKGTTKFADVQIFSGKVLGVLKVLRVIGWFC